MADFGAPVAQGIQVPNATQTISNVLGIKSQQLQLQQQRQALAGQAAQVQQEQQTARQRAGLAQFMQNYDITQHVGADGTLDLNDLLTSKEARAAAGDAFPDLIKQFADIKTSQLAAKTSLVNLNSASQDAFDKMLGGLRTDPDVIAGNADGKAKVQSAIGQFAARGPDEARAARLYSTPIDHTQNLAQTLSNMQLQGQSASEQAGNQRPSYISTGGTLEQVNPQAAGGGKSGSLKATIAPGRAPFTDTFGQVFTYNPQSNTYEPANKKPGGQVGASSPGDVEAVRNNAETNFRNITTNREAAKIAPQQIDQINKALALSKITSTGNWAEERGKLESGISGLIPGLATAKDDATRLNLLDKFSERIASDANRVLGANAGTDAQRESISKQNANIGYTPDAVQSVLKYAKAQTLAMEDKANAQETWLKQSGHGVSNHADFETQWRQSYDPVLYQLQVADPAERRKIVSELSPEEAKSLTPKHKALVDMGALGGQAGGG